MALSANEFIRQKVPLLSEKFRKPPYVNIAYGMSIEGSKFPHTGLFIYARLVDMRRENKEFNMFAGQMRREYSDFIDDLNNNDIYDGDTVPSSSSFSKYFYYLRKVNVLEDVEQSFVLNKHDESVLNDIRFVGSEGDMLKKFRIEGGEIKGRRSGKPISYHNPDSRFLTTQFSRNTLKQNQFVRNILDIDKGDVNQLPETFGINWTDINLDDLNIVPDMNKVNFALVGEGQGVSTEYGRRYNVILPKTVKDFQKVYRNQ